MYVSQGKGISGQSQAEQEFISIPNSKHHSVPKLDTPFPNKDRGGYEHDLQKQILSWVKH